MRYLLDTNILIFILLGKQKDELSSEIRNIIDDYSNIICTSSICVTELVQLYRIGKIKPKYKTAEAMVKAIENEFILKYCHLIKTTQKPFQNYKSSMGITTLLTILSYPTPLPTSSF